MNVGPRTTRKNERTPEGGIVSRVLTPSSRFVALSVRPRQEASFTAPSQASNNLQVSSLHVTKVLHVVETLDVGGTEMQMVQVALRLDPRRYHVRVACLRASGPLIGPLQAAGIEILEFTKGRTFTSFQSLYQLLRLAWYIHRERIDVVHAHHLGANLMAVPAARLARAPVILSSLRNLAHLPWYTPFRRKFMRLVYRLSTGVVANSEAIGRLLVEQFQVPADRVHIVHNGVDCERFPSFKSGRRQLHFNVGSEAKLIVNVANMHSPVKGHTDLIEAARTVCASIPQARFVFIGDGEQRPHLQEQVHQAGLDEFFVFLGNRDCIPELLSCCDLFVLASRAEGFPNALLEAMAAGLPVVATRVGGVPEIVEDGRSGLLVSPGNAAALAGAVIQLLQDPSAAARLATAGQQRVRKQFSLDRLIQDLHHLYEIAED